MMQAFESLSARGQTRRLRRLAMAALAQYGLAGVSVRLPFRRVTDQLGEVMQALGDGPEVFGLIHSDLGRSNTVFAGGKACAIDFDDCGFGYWLYGIATTLRRWRWTPQWPVLRDAFWAGYTPVHALPAEYIAHLDTFIAGRSVSIALWAAGKAKDHAGVRHDLHRWFETAACFVAQYEQRQAR